MVGDSNTVLLA